MLVNWSRIVKLIFIEFYPDFLLWFFSQNRIRIFPYKYTVGRILRSLDLMSFYLKFDFDDYIIYVSSVSRRLRVYLHTEIGHTLTMGFADQKVEFVSTLLLKCHK